MATLSTEDRARISRGLQRYWSRLFETQPLSKAELQAAIDATDAWIDANRAAFNAALPAAARTALTLAQKTLMFCVVAAMRVSVAFARHMIGEVN